MLECRLPAHEHHSAVRSEASTTLPEIVAGHKLSNSVSVPGKVCADKERARFPPIAEPTGEW